MSAQGTLAFDSYINTAPFLNGINQIRAGINTLPRITNASLGSVNSQFATGFGSIGKLIGGYLAFSQLKDLGKQIINVRSEMQSLDIAFRTMLKSKSAADKMMKQVIDFAAKTPFNVMEVGAATKSLLAYGFAASDVFKTLRRLSDISSGLKIPLNDLVYLYGTLRVQGRAYARDITQFAQRGIPIYDELAKVLGVNVDKVKELVSSGKVGFKEVEQAFANMTAAGGQFFDLTAKNSQTLNGLISNLGDKFIKMFNEIGESQEGVIIDGIKGLSTLVDHYEDVLKVLAAIVAAYGAYKAALFLINNANTIGTIVRSTQAYIAQALAIRSVAQAQAFLSATMTATSWALVAGAIIGVVTALVLYSDKLLDLRSTQEKINEANEEFAQGLDKIKQSSQEYLGIINDEASTRRQQIAAFNALAKLYPQALKNLDLDTFKRKSSTQAQKELNEAFDQFNIDGLNDRLKAAQGELKTFEEAAKRATDAARISPESAEQAAIYGQQVEESKKKVQDLQEQVEEFNKTQLAASPVLVQIGYYNDLVNSLKERKQKLLEAIRSEEKMVQVGESLKIIFQQMSLKDLNRQIIDANTSLENLKKTASETKLDGTYKDFQDMKKANEELLQNIKTVNGKTTTKEDAENWKLYSKNILLAQKGLDAYNITKKESKKDEVFTPGSLKAYDQAATKAKEALEKTNTSNVAQIQRYNQIRFENEEKAAELRKSLEIRSFEEELEYKRKEYQKFRSFAVNVSEEAARESYQSLISEGKSYLDYLQEQAERLRQKIDSGTDNSKDRANFFLVSEAIEDETQTFEKYKSKIDLAKESVATLTDYLVLLRQQQAKLNQSDIERTNFISGKILEVERERNALLRDFLVQTNAGGAGIDNIKKYYDSIRKTIYDNAKKTISPTAGLGMAVLAAVQLKEVTRAEGKAVTEMSVDTVRKTSQAYKELNRVILGDQKKVLRERLQQLQRYKEDLSAKGINDGDEFNQVTDDILVMQKELESATFQGYNDLLGIVQNIGGEFENIDGVLGQIGSALSGLSGAGGSFLQAIQGIASGNPVQAIGAVVNALVGMFTAIAKNRQENKEFLKDRGLAIAAQKRQYNELVREERRLASIENGNPFVKNYKGIIKDGSNALAAASKDYEASLKKLKNGIAKSGTKDYMDVKDLFKGLVLGAVGVFATGVLGKKTTDAYLPLLKLYPNLVKTLQNGKQEFDTKLAQSLIDNDRVDDATKQLLEEVIANVKEMDAAKEQILDVIVDLAGGIGDQLRDNLVNAFKEGGSAAVAFGQTVSQVIEEVISKALFSAIFGQAFDALTDDFKKSMDVAVGGDGKLDDDLVRFFKTYPQLAEVYFKGLADAKKQAESLGLDIFGSTSGTNGSGNSLSGSIKGITEQTAGLLAGQMNAIRIYVAQGVDINRTLLIETTAIRQSIVTYLPYLQSIDAKLGAMTTTDGLRAGGIKNF